MTHHTCITVINHQSDIRHHQHKTQAQAHKTCAAPKAQSKNKLHKQEQTRNKQTNAGHTQLVASRLGLREEIADPRPEARGCTYQGGWAHRARVTEKNARHAMAVLLSAIVTYGGLLAASP
eukprot:scaffold25535_cov143-Isochrysis_galbana.AAC.3